MTTESEWKALPDEQAWWWHWNGEDLAVPHIYGILLSCTGPTRYFVQYPDARWCDEMGGFWRKVVYPDVPSRDEQKRIAATRIPARASKGNDEHK